MKQILRASFGGLSSWLPGLVLVLLCCGSLLDAQVVINEIFYNEPGHAEDGEFVELLNVSTQDVDLDGWALADGVRFEFPAGEVLGPGEFLVVAASSDTLAAAQPEARIAGQYEGRLSNRGETLVVLDRRDRPVDRVSYSDDEDWPQAADGKGASLELINPVAPRDFPGNWAAGEPPTPGAPNGASGETLPTIAYDVEIKPQAVTSADPVTVSADVFSEEPIERVFLRLFVGAEVIERAMADDGLSPDRRARDGEYAVEVPPLPDRTFVTFKVIVLDQDGGEHAFPPGDDESDHYAWVVYDGSIDTNSPVVWLFLSPAKIRIIDANAQVRSTSDPRFVNFDQTFDSFVVLEGKVHRKVAVRHRGGFASRHAGRLKYSWRFEFPDWDRYHGRRSMLIIGNQHWDDSFMRGDNGLQDKLCYMTFDRAGAPASRTRFIRLMVNNEFIGYHVEVETIDNDYLERNGFTGDGDLYKHGRTFQAHNFPLSPAQYSQAYNKKTGDRNDYSSIRNFVEDLNAAARNRAEENLSVTARIWNRDNGTRPEEPTVTFSEGNTFDLSRTSVGLFAHNCLAEFDNVCVRGAESPSGTCDLLEEDGADADAWTPVLGDWEAGDGVLRLTGPVRSSHHRLAREGIADLSVQPITLSYDVRITTPITENNWAGLGLFLGDGPRHSFRGTLVGALRFRGENSRGLHLLDAGTRWLDESGEFPWEVGTWYRIESTVTVERRQSDIETFLRENVDIERYRRYLAAVILCTHWDSTSNNYFFYQDDLQDDRWVRCPIDMDITWGYSRRKRPTAQGHNLHPYDGTRFNPEPQEFMTSALREAFLSVPSFRDDLHDTLAEALVTFFTESELHPVVDRILETDGEESQMDVDKWNRLDRSWNWRSFVFHAEFDKIYVTKRRKYLAEFLDLRPLLSQASVAPRPTGPTDELTFRVNALGTRYDGPFNSGRSNLDQVQLHVVFESEPGERSFDMEAVNPRIDDFYELRLADRPASSRLYYRFSARDDRGRAGVLPDPERDGFEYYTLDLETTAPRPGDIVLNEILYRARYYNIEFVELKNNLHRALDLSGWKITSAEAPRDTAEFVFPPAAIIDSGGYLVLSRDTRAVFEYYNIVNLVSEDLPFSLDNKSDTLSLFDAGGTLIDRVTYADRAPWPEEPDGDGPSLELIDSRGDNALPVDWATSTAQGTPGRINSVSSREVPPQPNVGPQRAVFHRGDSDGNGSVDITDGLAVLSHLFSGGPEPGCLETADSNNDGTVNVADATLLFDYLFSGGAPPAAPGPPGTPCGVDPDALGSPGDLGCEVYDACDG